MAAESGEVMSAGQVGPPTQSTGGRSHTPLRNSPPPSDSIQPLGTGEHA